MTYMEVGNPEVIRPHCDEIGSKGTRHVDSFRVARHPTATKFNECLGICGERCLPYQHVVCSGSG